MASVLEAHQIRPDMGQTPRADQEWNKISMKVSEHCVKSWQQPLIISASEIHSMYRIFFHLPIMAVLIFLFWDWIWKVQYWNQQLSNKELKSIQGSPRLLLFCNASAFHPYTGSGALF